MKKDKKIIIISLIIVIFLIGFYLYNNRTVSKITLDINPSVEILLNKNDKVKRVKAINNEARELVSNNLWGKTLDQTLSMITNKVIETGYAKEGLVTILLYSDGKFTNNDVREKVITLFDKKNIQTDIIMIEDVTKEDEKLARKYNITLAKAAYINSIVSENEKIPLNVMLDKPISELKETKSRGNYCEDGYKLEGDNCVKKIGEEVPKEGNVCPNSYFEYEGKCYLSTAIEETDKLVCFDDFELTNNMCIRKQFINATPQYKCDKGELMKKGDVNPIGGADNDKMYCVDKSTAKAPILRCMIGPHMVINGKCYVGPAPVINGGCPNGDTLVNGGCYSLDPEDQWQCPNGSIYEKSKDTFVELCPDTFTYLTPTITGYTCPEGYTLDDKKCVNEEKQDAHKERVCKEGYTLVDYAACIDKNKTTDKVDGYYCENQNARLEDNKCIIYETVGAKH